MSENKLDNLETEVHELIKLSQQLKEINDHLSKKNIELSNCLLYTSDAADEP